MAKTSTGLSEKPKDVRERERQVMELIRAGLDLTEIAHQVGYKDHSAIVRIRDRVVDRYTQESTEAVRSTELDRLDALLQTLWPKARRGDYHAVDRILKIMERRAKYLGLEAPIELKIENVEQDKAEAEALVSKFRDKPKLAVVKEQSA